MGSMCFFFFQAEDGIRDDLVTGVQTCALPIWISARGEQRWFAQCGFEATSVTWLFPGETVRIDAPCLDCGDPVTVEMRDGRIVWLDPPEVVGHLNYGFGASRGKPQFL